jgi:hypothetical protein
MTGGAHGLFCRDADTIRSREGKRSTVGIRTETLPLRRAHVGRRPSPSDPHGMHLLDEGRGLLKTGCPRIRCRCLSSAPLGSIPGRNRLHTKEAADFPAAPRIKMTNVIQFPLPQNRRCKSCIHWQAQEGNSGFCHLADEETNSDYVCDVHKHNLKLTESA